MKVFLLPDNGMLPQIQLNEIILAPYSRLSHWANTMQFRILPDNFRSYRNHVYDYHKLVDSSRKYMYETVDLTPGPLYGLIHPARLPSLAFHLNL